MTNPAPPEGDARDEYQPRTRQRLIEILTAQGENPRSWQAEAAAMLAAPSPTADEAQIRIILERIVGEMTGCTNADNSLCDLHAVNFDHNDFEAAKAFLSRVPSEEATEEETLDAIRPWLTTDNVKLAIDRLHRAGFRVTRKPEAKT